MGACSSILWPLRSNFGIIYGKRDKVFEKEKENGAGRVNSYLAVLADRANKTVRFFWYGHHYIKIENDYHPKVDQRILMVIIVIMMIGSNSTFSIMKEKKRYLASVQVFNVISLYKTRKKSIYSI